MVLQIDPRLPLVWRSPTSLQFGVDSPPVVLVEVSEADERMLSALVRGVTRPGFELLAAEVGAGADAASSLLRALGPAMRDRSPAPAKQHSTVTIAGTGATVQHLADALGTAGVTPRLVGSDAEAAADGDGPAVVVAHYVVDPEFHGLWLRRDRPHLPVVFGDTGARIGPIVEPGTGPCLYCLERRRTDADPAWPAMACQLWGRRSAADAGLVAHEVATIAARMIVDRLQRDSPGDPKAIRLDAATGERTVSLVASHPECGCGALPGSGTAAEWRSGSARARPRKGGGRDAPG